MSILTKTPSLPIYGVVPRRGLLLDEPLSQSLRSRALAVFLALIGLMARFALTVHRAPFYDDAYITFRFASNFANGFGLTWIPGERVLGTSTPLYALLLGGLAKIFGPAAIPSIALAIGFISYAASCVFLLAMAERLRMSGTQTALLMLLFSLTPNVVLACVSGMETSFLLLLMLAGAYFSLAGRDVLAALACALLFATRVDSAAWIGALLLGCVVARRTVPWRGIGIFLAGAAAWMLLAHHLWGSFVPATAKTKMLVYHVSGSLPVRFAHLVSEILSLDNRMAWLLIVLPLLVGIMTLLRRRPVIAGTLVVFLLGYASAFAVARAILFPWYIVPATLAVLVAEAFGWAELMERVSGNRKALQVAMLLLLAGVYLAWTARDYRANWRMLQVPANLDVAMWLRHNAPHDATVFTEPAGIIGYYCDCKLRDSVGLVTPEVTNYWKRPGGREQWFSTALREMQPDFVVLRQHEYQTGILYATTDTPLFASASDQQWFQANYRQVFAAAPHVPTSVQDAFYVFEREK